MKHLAIVITVLLIMSVGPGVVFGKTCKEMKSCAEAKKELAAGNKSLDRDKDGIPCESLCKK